MRDHQLHVSPPCALDLDLFVVLSVAFVSKSERQKQADASDLYFGLGRSSIVRIIGAL